MVTTCSAAEQNMAMCEKALGTSSIDIQDQDKNLNTILKPQLYQSETENVRTSVLAKIVSKLTAQDKANPGPPPDGGWQAWTQCAMSWVVCFTTWGYINSFGVFQTHYSQVLGETQSTVAWIGSIEVWIVLFVSTVSGRALDAGLFVPSLVIGSVILILGVFATSFCTSLWQLMLAQGVCTGLGIGIISCPTIGLMTTYFTKNRGLAIAFQSTGNSIGGVVYPIMVRQLLPKIGFGWTVRVLGFMNMALLGAAISILRPRLPPRKSGPIIEWQVLREVPYVLVVIGMSFVFGGSFFSYYFIGSYGRDVVGMSYTDSTTLVIILNAAGLPMRIITGIVADRYMGPLNAMVVLIFINSLFAFTWIAIRTPKDMYIFSLFYGFSVSAFQCLFTTTITSLNNDLSKNGVRLGMSFSIFSFACLAGPPVGGALLELNGGGRGGWLVAQLVLGITTFLGACFMAAARVYKDGWSLKVKT